MSLIFLLLALAGFVAIGVGVSLLRSNGRSALAGDMTAKLRQWFGTLQGPRAIGAGLVAVGAVVIVLVLALRP